MIFWGYFWNIYGASIETAHKSLQWRICVSSSSAWLTSWILVYMTYWPAVQSPYLLCTYRGSSYLSFFFLSFSDTKQAKFIMVLSTKFLSPVTLKCNNLMFFFFSWFFCRFFFFFFFVIFIKIQMFVFCLEWYKMHEHKIG